MSSPTPSPLRRLLAHASGRHRGRVRLGVLFSVLNKLFDLAPPLLIGAAVSVVVDRETSWVSKLGIADPWTQLLALARYHAIFVPFLMAALPRLMASKTKTW